MRKKSVTLYVLKGLRKFTPAYRIWCIRRRGDLNECPSTRIWTIDEAERERERERERNVIWVVSFAKIYIRSWLYCRYSKIIFELRFQDYFWDQLGIKIEGWDQSLSKKSIVFGHRKWFAIRNRVWNVIIAQNIIVLESFYYIFA